MNQDLPVIIPIYVKLPFGIVWEEQENERDDKKHFVKWTAEKHRNSDITSCISIFNINFYVISISIAISSDK